MTSGTTEIGEGIIRDTIEARIFLVFVGGGRWRHVRSCGETAVGGLGKGIEGGNDDSTGLRDRSERVKTVWVDEIAVFDARKEGVVWVGEDVQCIGKGYGK